MSINKMFLLPAAVMASLSCSALTWEDQARQRENAALQATLEEQIGRLKYDLALISWGEPISVFNGDEIFVVTWGSDKAGPAVTAASPVASAVMSSTRPDSHGWRISAAFGKKSRLLISINRTVW